MQGSVELVMLGCGVVTENRNRGAVLVVGQQIEPKYCRQNLRKPLARGEKKLKKNAEAGKEMRLPLPISACVRGSSAQTKIGLLPHGRIFATLCVILSGFNKACRGA